jgi:hypothetical protein
MFRFVTNVNVKCAGFNSEFLLTTANHNHVAQFAVLEKQ